ncbi:ATP-dependent Clp protease ATP-binding subunit, partial [bacterium]|nr:ATP-dependent Clp protease ATP-binding subunit [bacterium]
LDLVSVFQPLTRAALEQIAAKHLEELAARLKERDIRLDLHKAVAKHIAHAVDESYGARDIRRHVQTHVEDRIADLIAQGVSGKMQLRVADGQLHVRPTRR